jgi:hypothetical protein
MSNKITYFLSLSTTCFLCYLHSKELPIALPLTIHLQHSEYHQGVMSTTQGGVIKGEDFRIQAKSIVYTKTLDQGKETHKVVAKEDLMLDYHGQIFLGDQLDYDFITKTGVILNGKTAVDQWFISGKAIHLHPDGSVEITEASITTSDDQVVFEMTADSIYLNREGDFSTKNIQFKCFNYPIFWIPSYKGNLKKRNDSPLRYSLSWDAGQGPKISMRYRVYSWERFDVYLRGDYRYARGPAGALEMDYTSPDRVTVFQSKNYIAHDTFYNDNDPNKKQTRYRLQGIYKTRSQDNKGHLDLIYDKISDKNMPGDFKGDDFELDTARQTRLIVRYLGEDFVTGVNVEPRINPFEGFKQELPTFHLNVKALKLEPSPLLLDNYFNLSYLDYSYSNQLNNAPPNIAAVLQNFHSIRAETHQEFYLPIHFKGMHFTPSAGFIGIAYTHSPDEHSIYQALATYECLLNTHLVKQFTHVKHKMTPYIQYLGLSKPLANFHEVYIFDINDGYHSINMLKVGIDNLFYYKNQSPFHPALQFNLYALGFLGDHTFHKTFPKAGVNVAWQDANLKILCDLRWNFNNHVLDFSNILIGYTFNANFAFSLEYRHRSRFDWRKDNHQSFILDVTQSIPSLLDSPLSDGRNVLLTKAEVTLTPRWVCQIQMHNGWGRKNQPGYTEAKIDCLGMLSSAWRLKLSYAYTTRGASHFGIGLDLVR